jgi:hypothetical protein
MSLSAKTPISPRLLELTDAACTSELAATELGELDAMLRADPAARRFYAEYCRMHAELYFAIRAERAVCAAGGRGVESRESRVESGGGWSESLDSRILNPEVPVINLQTPTLNSRLSTLSSWTFSYSVATVLLAVALLGAWSYTFTHPDPDSLAANNSGNATSSGSVAGETPEFTFVGHVSGMIDCQWADDVTATYAGAAVALNRRYALRSGLMEITYDSGAKVILQGPCEYTVESPRGGYLAVGKLVARVGAGDGGRGAGETTNLPSPFGRGVEGEGSQPHSQSALTLTLSQRERGQNFSPAPHTPRPTPLFAVRTPIALVEDLGTEFGVEVSDSGETASHVFQGKVVMKVSGDGGRGTGDEKSEIRNQKSEILLSAGESSGVDRDGRIIAIAAGKLNFTRVITWPDPRAYAKAVLADEPLCYWTFDEPADLAFEQVRREGRQALHPIGGATRCAHAAIGSGLALGRAADFSSGEAGCFTARELGQGELHGAWAVEFWMQSLGSRAGSTNQYILNASGYSSTTTNRPGVIFDFNEHGADNELQLFSLHGKTAGGPTIDDDRWHHVMLAYVKDKQNADAPPLILVFIDGRPQTAQAGSFRGHFDLDRQLLFGAGRIEQTNQMLDYESRPSNGFRGRLDELAIYDLDKLAAETIESHMKEMAQRHIAAARGMDGQTGGNKNCQ